MHSILIVPFMALPLIKKAPFPKKLIEKELASIEEAVLQQARLFDPGIQDQIKTICNTGGKRIRPALALLVGGATGNIQEAHTSLGVVIELIHVASLVHDDIIDEAETRRNKPTASSLWGSHTAVLLGDVLFAHALSLSTEVNDLHFSRSVGDSARHVCTGEILQTKRRFDFSLTEEEYFHIIRLKTGALFATSCELSGYINKQTKEQCQNLHDYGMALGTAYQIYDDILDLCADETDAGKTLRTDLTKGKLTLPLFCLLKRATTKQVEQIRQRFEQQQPITLEELQQISGYQEAISAAITQGKEILTQGYQAISWLPKNAYQQALQSINSEVSTRLEKLQP